MSTARLVWLARWCSGVGRGRSRDPWSRRQSEGLATPRGGGEGQHGASRKRQHQCDSERHGSRGGAVPIQARNQEQRPAGPTPGAGWRSGRRRLARRRSRTPILKWLWPKRRPATTARSPSSSRPSLRAGRWTSPRRAQADQARIRLAQALASHADGARSQRTQTAPRADQRIAPAHCGGRAC